MLPAPGSILTGFVEIVRSGEIWTHAAASLVPHRGGLRPGAVALSLLMGLGAFVSRTARGIVTDLLAILNSTSVFVWIVVSLDLVRAQQLGARSSPRS